jgi:hypothetical protein
VRLRPRADDKHYEVVLEVEDDENWFEKMSVSSYWLDEMIGQLQLARDFLSRCEPDVAADGQQYGWRARGE